MSITATAADTYRYRCEVNVAVQWDNDTIQQTQDCVIIERTSEMKLSEEELQEWRRSCERKVEETHPDRNLPIWGVLGSVVTLLHGGKEEVLWAWFDDL